MNQTAKRALTSIGLALSTVFFYDRLQSSLPVGPATYWMVVAAVWVNVVYAGLEVLGFWTALDRARGWGQAIPRNDQELEDRWER